MNQLILEDGSLRRRHRKRLGELVASTKGKLRIATAYVTDRELLKGAANGETRLLISLSLLDVAAGATSLEALRWMLKSGVECRVLPARPRLHAKVYIFGTSTAVVTSANLTGSALDSNIEVGVEVGANQVTRLSEWFDRLWEIAVPLTPAELAEWQRKAPPLRHAYMALKAKAKSTPPTTGKHLPTAKLTDSHLHLFSNARRFFVCNTDRRYDERTRTGGYRLEQRMRDRGFAAAWEKFKFPGHMEQVRPGDAVFMFAKGVGIIGIGVASARCQTLSPNDPDCVGDTGTTEWRVPVKWLEWTDEAGAYPYKPPNFTFWNVTGSGYSDFRDAVRSHFVSDC